MENSKVKNIRYYNLVVFIIALIAIIFTKCLAKPIVPLLDFVGYGAMRPFFVDLFTCIFWIIEIIIISFVYKKQSEVGLFFEKKEKKQELPMKNVLIIGGIVIACIVIISAQIGFQVKPFYDLGEKFNGYELTNHLGVFMRNIVKSMWIVIMIKTIQEFVEDIFGKGKSMIPYGGIVLLLTLGIYDIIAGMNNLQWTYLALNMVYAMIYTLTDRSVWKSYFVIMFIYLF